MRECDVAMGASWVDLIRVICGVSFERGCGRELGGGARRRGDVS